MNKRRHNEGFSLVELLVSIAILSIIMLMIVQFMSTSTAADKKTKYNLKAQTTSDEVLYNITENLAKASYVRVIPAEGTVYEMPAETRINSDNVTTSAKNPTKDCSSFSFDLVPDNYANYVRNTSTPGSKLRDSIVELETFKLPGQKKNSYYPLVGDLETPGKDIRSFRCMKQDDGSMLYLKPSYIYLEFTERTVNPSGVYTDTLQYVIYRFDYAKNSIYMYKSPTAHDVSDKYVSAIGNVDGLSGTDGLLTDNLEDFYLSCDAKGGAFYFDSIFDVKGYKFNGKKIVTLRNSNILTAPPEIATFMKGKVVVDEEGNPTEGGE